MFPNQREESVCCSILDNDCKHLPGDMVVVLRSCFFLLNLLSLALTCYPTLAQAVQFLLRILKEIPMTIQIRSLVNLPLYVALARTERDAGCAEHNFH